MIDIGDACLALLGQDLRIEFVGHPVEVGYHQLELSELPTLLVHLKSLQAD